ncbi:Cytochrome p450 [Globisporangium polare]
MLALPPFSSDSVALVVVSVVSSIRRKFAKSIHCVYDFQVDLMTKLGGRIKIPWNVFADSRLYIASPADVEHVLATNVDNYIKSDRLIAAMGECDMHTVASQYTLQTIFDIALGVSLESIDAGLGLKFIKAMDFVFANVAVRGVTKPYYKYLRWCMPSEYRLKRESKVLLGLVDSILKERMTMSDDGIAHKFDILSLFIKKKRKLEAKEGVATILDAATLCSTVTSAMFAGRDTTASTIVYAFYNIAQYPEEQEKVLNELFNLRGRQEAQVPGRFCVEDAAIVPSS